MPLLNEIANLLPDPIWRISSQKSEERDYQTLTLLWKKRTPTSQLPTCMAMGGKAIKFVTYGCQMNVNDTEVVRSVLFGNGYVETDSFDDANVVLLMTCSIREGAETKIWEKLQWLRAKKNIRLRHNQDYTIGILGCMAERLKQQLLEKSKNVDIVAGPDSYRDLPRLLAVANTGQSAGSLLLTIIVHIITTTVLVNVQ
uniref:MTTase N-terminal domain-containing protein n=1 Tax=Plectus sambesii TaxID=2011161 RepID=A0A914UTH7_9BILA